MSRLFLLALLALVGLASGFAPVNTPSVVGKFNGGGIGENREEKERERVQKSDGVRPSDVFRARLMRREVETGRKRRPAAGRCSAALCSSLRWMYRLWCLFAVRSVHGEQDFPSQSRFSWVRRSQVGVSLKLPHDGR